MVSRRNMCDKKKSAWMEMQAPGFQLYKLYSFISEVLVHIQES